MTTIFKAIANFFTNVSDKVFVIIAGAFFFLVFFGPIAIAGYMDTHYSTTAEVLSVEDEVILVDGAGYVWGVTNRPDLHKGDFVKISFDNNCTDYTRNDDIIIKVKKLDN